MTVLEISLTDLLNDKWEILSGAPATGFVLRKGANGSSAMLTQDRCSGVHPPRNAGR